MLKHVGGARTSFVPLTVKNFQSYFITYFYRYKAP